MKLVLNIKKCIRADKTNTFPIPVKTRFDIFFFAMIIFLLFLQNEIVIAGPAAQTDSGRTAESITEPRIYPSSLWLAAQTIPSPQLIIRQNSGPAFGLRWQVTPLLYSWGINKKLSPWRHFIAEPLTRQNGSAELYLSPEYVNLTDQFKSNWMFRAGLRAYFPLYNYGEYLSGSVGTSYYTFNGHKGVSYEAGIYIFFGILGLQVSYSPSMPQAQWMFTLRIRYF